MIIVPAYNEEEAIGRTLSKLLSIKTSIPTIDICVINDGSKDQTAKVVGLYSDVILLDLPNNLGIGGAVQTGYKYAHHNHYDIALQFDADGQHNEKDLITVLTPIINGECDMCIGSRFVEKTSYTGSRSRRMGIYYFELLLYLLTRQKYTDATSGYRAINRKVISLFADNYPRDYPEPEVILYLHRKKLRVKEISVNMNERQGGTSSITPFRSMYYMFKVTLSILMQKLIKG
ncbi:glycosyltransferase family 2 protein [Bacillus sp. FJAT-29790]|nr:glycosyltransferase family 2 protein [Bacillus sp. FJAT-29790]